MRDTMRRGVGGRPRSDRRATLMTKGRVKGAGPISVTGTGTLTLRRSPVAVTRWLLTLFAS